MQRKRVSDDFPEVPIEERLWQCSRRAGALSVDACRGLSIPVRCAICTAWFSALCLQKLLVVLLGPGEMLVWIDVAHVWTDGARNFIFVLCASLHIACRWDGARDLLCACGRLARTCAPGVHHCRSARLHCGLLAIVAHVADGAVVRKCHRLRLPVCSDDASCRRQGAFSHGVSLLERFHCEFASRRLVFAGLVQRGGSTCVAPPELPGA